jgi:hypothetical protein
MNSTATINLKNPIQIKQNLGVILLKKTLIFIYKVLRYIIHSLHIFFDKILALNIYFLLKWIWSALYIIEKWTHNYLKKSKYIEDDRFDPGIEYNRVIMLGMWLKNVNKITNREIVREMGVSEWYARKFKHIANNYVEYFHEYAEIWKDYKSDSEKRDKRSVID